MGQTRADAGIGEGSAALSQVVDLSEEPPPRPRAWPVAGAWTALASLQALAVWTHAGVPLAIAVFQSLVEYGLLALLAIPVWRFSARFTAARWRRSRLLLAHGLLGLAVLAVWRGSILLMHYAVMGRSFWKLIYADSWMFQVLSVIVTYAAMLGVILLVQAGARDRARERREAALTVAAREAELLALKAHLQPHFLFNALNSLLALIDSDPVAAKGLLARLAELLHAVVRRLDADLVPLSQEVEILRSYLDIEQVRFGARLAVAFEIEEPSRTALVPPLILQPLVENAIKHGIAPHPRPGRVRVAAGLHGAELRLTVTDSGDGTDGVGVGVPGRGLELTRRRLQAVYPGAHQILFARGPAGFSVELRFPAAGHAA